MEKLLEPAGGGNKINRAGSSLLRPKNANNPPADRRLYQHRKIYNCTSQLIQIFWSREASISTIGDDGYTVYSLIDRVALREITFMVFVVLMHHGRSPRSKELGIIQSPGIRSVPVHEFHPRNGNNNQAFGLLFFWPSWRPV